MERLSPQSMLSAVGLSGQTPDSSPTPQHGSIVEVGPTSRNLPAIRAKLVSQEPEDTDRNLVQWLTSGLKIRPTESVRMTYPTTGGYRREVTGYSFAGLTAENRAEAMGAVNDALTPAEIGTCEGWVSALYAVTSHRTDDVSSMKIILRLYSDTLAQYPADVAKAVTERFMYRAERPNFFPTLSELKIDLDRLSLARRLLARDMEKRAC